MSNVTISVAGRQYTIACSEGEEAHIAKLGAAIDSKLASLPNISGQSEARLLLYAALLLADEAFEANHRTEQDIAPQLEALATRLESVASALEHNAHAS